MFVDQVVRAFAHYNMDILGVTETRILSEKYESVQGHVIKGFERAGLSCI